MASRPAQEHQVPFRPPARVPSRSGIGTTNLVTSRDPSGQSLPAGPRFGTVEAVSEGVSFQLKGWPAVIAVVVVLGFAGLKFVSARQTLDTEAAEQLKFWLSAEYMRSVQAREGLEPEERMRLVEAAQEIEFADISARGSGEEIIVRVELEPNPAEPPDEERVRYFEMSYSGLTGWQYERETSAFSYHLKLF